MRSCSYRTKEISAVSTKKAEQPSGVCGSAVRRIRFLSIVWALALLAPVHESGAFPLGEGTFGYSVFGDSDNDLAPDSVDVFPNDPNEAIDSDWDGIGDNADEDDDNDGTNDASDAFPFDFAESLDTDGDGVGNNSDDDDDGDGILDPDDPEPLISNVLDTDGDGIKNIIDNDDDGDGFGDEDDSFPLDATEWTDTDNDGIGNNTDLDDDGDGVQDRLSLIHI